MRQLVFSILRPDTLTSPVEPRATMKYILWVIALMLACVPRGRGAVLEDSARDETNNVTNNTGLRGSQSLNGDWHIVFDPENIGKQERWYEHFPSSFAAIRVPGVWNEIRPGYQGVAWYQKSFSAPIAWQGKSVRVCFGAVSYLAEVWLNGKYLGMHEGGYTPFEIEAGESLFWGAENQLVVRVLLPPRTHGSLPDASHPQTKAVDGFALEETPNSKQAWYDNFGGIWQDADLVMSGRIRVENCFIQPDIHAEKINVQCQLNNQTNQDSAVAIALVAKGKQQQTEAGFRASKELKLPEAATTNVEVSVNIPHPEGGGQRPRLQRTVNGTGSATFALHLHYAWNCSPDVGHAFRGPLVGPLAHRGGGCNGVNGDDFVEAISNTGYCLIRIHRLDLVCHSDHLWVGPVRGLTIVHRQNAFL
jgi:hypothetical protein